MTIILSNASRIKEIESKLIVLKKLFNEVTKINYTWQQWIDHCLSMHTGSQCHTLIKEFCTLTNYKAG